MTERTEFCPECEEERPVEVISGEEKVTVRGEEFIVSSIVRHCTVCGAEYTSSSDPGDPVESAFSQYRNNHNMVAPADIREFRKKYELTQKELALLLGWGAVTLSRYENGALQDLAHDRELQSAMTADGLRKLIELTPDALPRRKRTRLLEILSSNFREGILGFLEEKLASLPASMMNGCRRFSLGRFAAVVEALLGEGGVFKTKLLKELFLVDFLHFREYGVSITGCCYARLPYGPVPNDYGELLAAIENQAELISTEMVSYSGIEYTGEKIHSTGSMNEYSLTDDERETIARVMRAFKDYSAGEMVEYSHRFEGWLQTEHANLIDYQFSDFIDIPV